MKLELLPLEKLRHCRIMLRPVCKETLEYYELRDSISEHGVLNSILTRKVGDLYEVIDGNHRFSVSLDLHLPLIPAIIGVYDDSEINRLQIQANALHIQTNPVQYARRLWRMVEIDKSLTLPELAHSLHKNVDWTKRMIGLVGLSPKATELLSGNEVSLSVAIELAKLSYGDQDALLPVMKSMTNREFVELVRGEARRNRQGIKQLRSDQRQRDSETLQPVFRTRRELTSELESPTMMAAVFSACNAQTDMEKWQATLKFVLSIDPLTLEKRGEKNE